MTFIFPYIGDVIIPIDELIFFRGLKPPTRMVFGGFPWRFVMGFHHMVRFFTWRIILRVNHDIMKMILFKKS